MPAIARARNCSWILFGLALPSMLVPIPAVGQGPSLSEDAGADEDALDAGAADHGSCERCHRPIEELLALRSYRMYSGIRIDMRTDAQPALESLICLSCHDGSGMDVAFDGPLREQLDIGTDLQNDHPISIQYDPSLDRAFHPVTTGPVRQEGVNGLPLYNGRVECPTCHDPHGPAAGRLRMSNKGSALCLACHMK